MTIVKDAAKSVRRMAVVAEDIQRDFATLIRKLNDFETAEHPVNKLARHGDSVGIRLQPVLTESEATLASLGRACEDIGRLSRQTSALLASPDQPHLLKDLSATLRQLHALLRLITHLLSGLTVLALLAGVALTLWLVLRTFLG